MFEIHFFTDYEKVKVRSAAEKKPIVRIADVQDEYARNEIWHELSHPLMGEVLNNEFIVLYVLSPTDYNEDVLGVNNGVIHLDFSDCISDRNENVSLYDRLKEALQNNNKRLPLYFQLLEEDLKLEQGRLASMVYETPCFWSGETTFAEQSHIYNTEAGFVGHKEVVKIDYDPGRISIKALDNYAINQGFYLIENPKAFKVDKNPQFYLKKSNFKYLPLSRAQRTKINYALPYNLDPTSYLSPTQKKWFKSIDENTGLYPETYTSSIREGWKVFKKQLKKYYAEEFGGTVRHDT